MISNLISYNINSGKNNIISGSTDNFNYNVNLPADYVSVLNSVSVISCSLPKSFYQINEQNNIFYLVEDGQLITITVTPGNYTVQQWFTYLSSVLTSSSLFNIVYVVSFQFSTLDNGIMKITASDTITPIFIRVPNSSISGVLGFD